MEQTEEPHKSHHQQHPEENEHHEKSASKMFRKVKAKAKKMKNNLTNKPDQSYEHDLDAEEDDDLEPSPEDVTRTFATGEDDRYLGGQRKVTIETPKRLEEDPAPPGGGSDYLSGVSNYQSEVADPTKQGSGEAESLGRKKVTDESSDQRSRQELAKEVDHLLHNKWIPCVEFESEEKKEADGSTPGSCDGRYWTKWKLPLFGCTDSDQVLKEVQECKKEYPNAFIRIIGLDNRQVECTSFIAYKPDERDSSTRRHEFGKKDEAGRDLQTGTHDQFSPELSRPKEIDDSGDRRDEATATKEKKPSTYTEQFVSATSAITNNAIAAKNALASKLGYSGESGGNKNESSSVVEDEAPRSATGYGQKVAGTVPEKLTPVNEKVKETGSTVMKKLPISGGVLGVVEEKERGEEKSGSSARHYLSEKMRPGEEDKALSEMITEKLHLGGGENKTTKSKEVEVTVDKIPAEQIVEEKANTEVVTGEQGNVGGGMVGKVKGTISSWLGGTKEGVKPKSPRSVEESPQSLGTTVGTKGFPDSGARGD